MKTYREYFEKRKPTKWSEGMIKWWHKRMLQIAFRFIPREMNPTILEIGVGHGFFAAVCKSQGITYLGYEMNTDQAEFLSSLGYEIKHATIPPIPSGKPVQIIWLSHVLEHASTYQEARNMLQAAYERLESGGYIVVIAPDLKHWKSFFWANDWSHGFPTTLTRVEQLLNETQFSVCTTIHHSCTITQPFFAWFLSKLCHLMPIELIDFITKKLFNKRFGSSFMSLFGYRQIYLIGKKDLGLNSVMRD